MSELDVLRQLTQYRRTIDQVQVIERPAIRPPYTAIALSPTAITATMGAFPQSKPINLLAFRCSVFVATTNNGGNFWTIALISTAGVTLASFTTAAIAANTWTRFAVTTGITQPATTNTALLVTATLSGAPGVIHVVPEVLLLETGN